MARILNGILGGGSGKVAGVVMAAWKGINYLKGYAIPANPQTVAQTAQRNKFSFTVLFAKTILSSVINKFWEKMNTGMSGFNSFMKQNVSQTDNVTGLTVTNKILSGSLEGSTQVQPAYNAITGALDTEWQSIVLGNGLATDKVLIVVFDKANNVSFVSDAISTRTSGTETINIGAGRTATDILVFIGLYRGTAPNYLMSDSSASFAA